MQRFDIEIYSSKEGKGHYSKWYQALPEVVKEKVRARLFRAEQGNLGDFKSLGNCLYELRFFIGSGYRIYFGKDGLRLIVILSGGDKSGQSRDVKLAKKTMVRIFGE